MNLTMRLRAATDLDLSVATVERAVRERLRSTGAGLDYDPQPGTAEFDALVDLVVVPESWILRDPAVFDVALRFVQARLVARPGQCVRVLSLPCAGGEEPYSLAMLLARAGILPAQCRIDAFDLSHAAIARARAGRFTRNAFRGDDGGLRERFFAVDGADRVIGAEPRAYVGFVQANLFDVDPAATGRYDLIFCRNLLIYFDAATQARAAARIAALLDDDGLLIAGYAETPALCRHGFAPRTPRDTFALRKQGRRAQDATPPAPSAPRPALPPLAAPPSEPPPSEPNRLLAEARRHADASRLAQAEDACRAALARQPDNADAWFLLGLMAECGGRQHDAERCWRRCVYLDPDHYEALCALTLLCEQRGDAGPGADYRRRAARIHARNHTRGGSTSA